MGLPTSPDIVAPAAVTLGELLVSAVALGASDLHIRSGVAPLVRIDGELHSLDTPPLSEHDATRLVDEALAREADRLAYQQKLQHDFALVDEHGERFRGSAYRMRGTSAMVLRHVRGVVPTLADLGLPPVIRNLALTTSGLIIVAGPTGSGKSTTLASMVDCINASRACHILTIEDPIEFTHQDQLASVSQREVPTDTPDFASALRSGMRQDPDVILVGEIRDLETMTTALYAAETGHLVLASLHAKSSVDAINRILDIFPSHEQRQARNSLAESLRGVICQRLVPTIRGGRRALCIEVAVGTTRLQDAIADPDRMSELESIIADGQFYGMRTFQQDLVRLVVGKTISLEEAEQVSSRPSDLRVALKQAGFKE